MKDFTVFDLATGRVLRWGNCPEGVFASQAGAGEGVIEGKFDATYKVIGGQAVKVPASVPVPGYQELRRQAYPPIAEQLDALWKGGEVAEDMRARVQAVKERFPKC